MIPGAVSDEEAESAQPSYRELFERLRAAEPRRSLLTLLASALIALGVVALPVVVAIAPLILLEGGQPSLARMILGVGTATVLSCAAMRKAARKQLWADPVKARLSALLNQKAELSEEEESEQEDVLEPALTLLRMRRWSPLGGPSSRDLRASTLPLRALAFSALIALWLPGVEMSENYFMAIAQVIPVLMVAAFVEGGALYRIFLPIYSSRLANDSGAPTHPVFYSFLRYMKGVLRLAVLGEVAALGALGADSRSALLGSLSAVAALGVALALIEAFAERLDLDQFKRTRSPGGWEGK